MRKIHWNLKTGLLNCTYEGTFDVKNDATDEEIENIVFQEVCNRIDWTWAEINNKFDK